MNNTITIIIKIINNCNNNFNKIILIYIYIYNI